MRFKCCKSAISSLMVINNSLSFCYCLVGSKQSFYNDYNGEKDFVDVYLNAREDFIKNCKTDKNIPEQCIKCVFFKEDEWDESVGIDYIVIANRSKCSCNCIYCVATKGDLNKRKELNARKIYDIRPLLETLAEKKLLKQNGTIYLEGGDCSEYPSHELRWIVDYAKENNFHIDFPSSGMFYSKEIEHALKKYDSNLTISVDSGTKETYEKIKRVKYYDKVWSNIKKYIKVAKANPLAKVYLKYIILDGINDNIDEFNAFLKKCDEVGCDNIYVNFDYNWMLIEDKIYKDKHINSIKLFNYIENLNNKKISTELIQKSYEIKTSAKIYSSDIEQSLKNGNTILKIILFSALENTYKKITNTDMFNDIWRNIEKYSKLVNKDTISSSKIIIQYKIMQGINDSVDELNALVLKCKQYFIKDIEIDLYRTKNEIDVKIDSIKRVIKFFKEQEDLKVSFSEIIKYYENI